MSERLYFAHAVNCYDTPYETAALALIAHAFPGVEIVNPNRPEHQAGYNAWRDRTATSRDEHKGMDYFYDVVLPECTGSIGMPFLDGRFGLGVAGELAKTAKTGKPVYWMIPTAVTTERLARWVKDPHNGPFVIRLLRKHEVYELLSSGKDGSPLVVGHQETRLRTWTIYNVTKRPYEAAHLVSMPIPPGFYPDEKK
ncbi:MAG TPA: hypothetical protein VMJ72_02935 [Candidatus Paceibacterota bacterium]|nr:hypothetical protein [Candidatus Paceibacterota bacterium]